MRTHFAPGRLARLGAVSALLVGGLLASANPASAASPATDPTTDPNAQAVSEFHWSTGTQPLTPTDFVQQAPAAHKLQAAVAAAAATSCWHLDDYRGMKDLVGFTLFTFHTYTAWCGDGSWIRSYAYTNADATTAVTWRYFGLTRNYDEYGVNWNQFHSVREGQFCLGYCVIQEKRLLNDILVGPAGQVYHQ